MIYTSYYAVIRKYGISNGIAISLSMPKGLSLDRYTDLAPSHDLLWRYKNGMVSQEQYALEYQSQLDILDPKKVYNDLDGKTLLCWEKSGDFCHRNIVAAWLIKNGYLVEEL